MTGQFRKPEWRMYIDEAGTAHLRFAEKTKIPDERYLCLVGVIVKLADERTIIAPRLDALKRNYFPRHLIEPVVLHRKPLRQKNYPFESLRDPFVEAWFNLDFLNLLETSPFRIVAVVIDKLAHRNRYSAYQHPPYHYCLDVLVERFISELRACGSVGDIVVEAIAPKHDRFLQEEYRAIYRTGGDHNRASTVQAHLTSGELDFGTKNDGYVGLELADMFAHVCRADLANTRTGTPLFSLSPLEMQLRELLQRSKYRRKWDGTIEGYGAKWLP
jgi:hypothetical protein